MLPWLVERVLQAILSMLVVISIVFVLARLSGNPLHLLLDVVNATEQDIDILTRHLGLDKPLLVQYAIYLKNIALGDIATSILTRRPGTERLWERLPATLELGVVGMAWSIILGVPIGVYSAVLSGGALDSVACCMGGAVSQHRNPVILREQDRLRHRTHTEETSDGHAFTGTPTITVARSTGAAATDDL